MDCETEKKEPYIVFPDWLQNEGKWGINQEEPVHTYKKINFTKIRSPTHFIPPWNDWKCKPHWYFNWSTRSSALPNYKRIMTSTQLRTVTTQFLFVRLFEKLRVAWIGSLDYWNENSHYVRDKRYHTKHLHNASRKLFKESKYVKMKTSVTSKTICSFLRTSVK